MIWLIGAALAHDFRPAVLEVREAGQEIWVTGWRNRGPLDVRLEGCVAREEVWRCPSPSAVRVSGFTPASQVLVHVIPSEGPSEQALLHGGRNTLALRHDRGILGVLRDYGRLGTEHILVGFDHLCFVLGLTCIVRKPRRLVGTLTAFTVAHSLTLACVTLGVFSLPAAPVEATIALSIALLGRELVVPEPTLVTRVPYGIAFGFGLLHGFGFAGALAELGVPAAAQGTALLGFNLGVELGQLLFVALMFLVAQLVGGDRSLQRKAIGYGIGILGMAWTLDRILGF